MNHGIIQPTGEERARSMALVREVLERTGNIIRTPAQTPDQEAFKRLAIVKNAVAQIILKYHEDHPLATNLPDLIKMIQRTHLTEFARFSKEDCIELLSMQQTILCLKQFGYE